MSASSPTGPVAATLPPVAGAMLESLYQHRVLATRQLHQMHNPTTGLRWTHQVLQQLAQAGLTGWVRAGRGGVRLHHLTAAGADAIELIPSRAELRRRLITPAKAVGPLQAHTLAVNDTGIAFMNTARARGDECEPLAWRHEIAHPTGPARPGNRSPLLIADALISYLQTGGGKQLVFHSAFIELDRATQPVDALADKLARYATLHSYTPKGAARPGWAQYYAVFPYVLCVMAGKNRPALERRRQTALALAHADPALAATRHVQVRACLLEDLTTQGPFAAIFRSAADPGRPVTWLGASS